MPQMYKRAIFTHVSLLQRAKI